MIIIELFGPPGSGKSTIADIVVENLIFQHYSVRTLNDFRKEKDTGFISLIFKNVSLAFRLICFIAQERMHFDKDKIRYIKSILMIVQYYKTHSDADYLIMEQGWIQDLISLCYSHKIRNTKILSNICNALGSLCIPIVTEIDVDKSFNRMQSRNKEPGRLDGEKPNDQKYIYWIMHENIITLKKQFPSIKSLDTTIDPKKNAEIIVKFIVFRGNN